MNSTNKTTIGNGQQQGRVPEILTLGKIYAKEWFHLNNEQIKKKINDSVKVDVVYNVERIYSRNGSNKMATPLIKVLLDDELWKTSSSKIIVDDKTYDVIPFVKEPRGCDKCLEFDHEKSQCRQEFYTCKNCGGKAEKDEILSTSFKRLVFKDHKCTKIMKPCVNCVKRGLNLTQHSPFSGECPSKKAQLAIDMEEKKSKEPDVYETVSTIKYQKHDVGDPEAVVTGASSDEDWQVDEMNDSSIPYKRFY